MTKEKWFEVYDEEFKKACDKNMQIGPETWVEWTKHLHSFIDSVSEATEVYDIENKGE
jgi:hypothetical protein